MIPRRTVSLLLGLLLVAAAGFGGQESSAPVAAVKPHPLISHGQTRMDNYYWLAERENTEVLSYLAAENAYVAAAMLPTEKLQQRLIDEMKNRMEPDDASAPVELNGWWYATRFVPGGDYPLHCRRQGSLDAPEEVMLDGNAMGAGLGYFALAGVEVSPDSRLLAFGVDTVGRRFYDLRFKDLTTGELLPDEIPDATGNLAWAMDNRTVFYARQDPITLRSHRIWRHALGTPAAADVLVYEEADDTYTCHVARTKSDAYLLIVSDQTLATEVRYLAADNPTGVFAVFQPRRRGLEYHVDHQGERFLIRTNLDAENFRLMECGRASTGTDDWREVVPHRADVLLEDCEVFADWLVLTERRGGLSRLRVIAMDGSAPYELEFGDPTWSVRTDQNPQMKTDRLRYGYSSLTTPSSVYTWDLKTRERVLLKQDRVLGDFDPTHYESYYLHATARDGTLVPVSLVARRGLVLDGSHPLLLYGYGSYGASMSARFDANLLSLLDRGFVYAIAHVRGGQEMGRRWYEDGKLLKKMNTFTDFIDCGKFLVDEGYTSTDRLFAMGGSAGGLLMGAIINLEPSLWRGVVAHVPFVDVVTTMLDDSIPLTTGEYDEWGDPRDRKFYDAMLAYSPYDNVGAQAYPALLVTTGLHDSQVQYFEPAKWVAKLRALKTDDHPLLLKTNMDAGHGGKSGRFRRLEERALAYAFVLDLAGIRE